VFESVHHFVEVAVDGEVVSTTAHRASGGVLENAASGGALAAATESGQGRGQMGGGRREGRRCGASCPGRLERWRARFYSGRRASRRGSGAAGGGGDPGLPPAGLSEHENSAREA
jgi:hypothetical protein